MLASWQSIESDAAPATHLARYIADVAQRAINERGTALVALSGGRTPRATYTELAKLPLAWEQLTFVPTDERFVAPTHEFSNEGMLRAALLQGPAASAYFISLWSSAATAAAAATTANQRLSGFAQPFDFVLLGMGMDGHVASLFPGAEQLAAALGPQHGESVAPLMPGPGAPPPAVERLTLTLPRLLNARRICLLVSGQAKRELLLRAVQESAASRWPVSALFSASAPPVDVIWFEEDVH
jgi:6-phosphogluconolactonase